MLSCICLTPEQCGARGETYTIVIVRKLEYLIALAKEGHFARAAAACHVSQPTLSAGIQQLEIEMGVLIVKRGQRFQGLTEEGERVLAWAQRMASECERLREELRQCGGEISGKLRIGVIPSALPLISALTTPFHEEHPGASLRVLGLNPVEIEHGFDEFTLDAAITYIDDKARRYSRVHPLYAEEYVLLTRQGAKPPARTPITWAELRKLPLCLLTPEMQSSGAIPVQIFGETAGTAPSHIDTNSITALFAYVRSGEWSAVVPATMAAMAGAGKVGVGVHNGFEAVPLPKMAEPVSVGLAIPHRDPASMLAAAFFDVATSEDVLRELQKLLPSATGQKKRIARAVS
jgi:DNA-binding transcriptional LysR family regulator